MMFNLDLLAWLVLVLVVAVATALDADTVGALPHVQNVGAVAHLAELQHVGTCDSHSNVDAGWATDMHLGSRGLETGLDVNLSGGVSLWVTWLRIASHLLWRILAWHGTVLLRWVLLRHAILLGWVLTRHLLRRVLAWHRTVLLWWHSLRSTVTNWLRHLRLESYSCADLSLGNLTISVNNHDWTDLHRSNAKSHTVTRFPNRSQMNYANFLALKL